MGSARRVLQHWYHVMREENLPNNEGNMSMVKTTDTLIQKAHVSVYQPRFLRFFATDPRGSGSVLGSVPKNRLKTTLIH